MTDRRSVLRLSALGAAALGGCARGGSSANTLPASPAARTELQPALPSAPPTVPTSGWQAEWDSLIAAAQREGALSVITWGDAAYRPVFRHFQQVFGVTVQHLPESSAPVWLNTVRTQRRAGAYNFDLGFVHPDYAISQGAPDRLWAPIKPLLFHPEVTAADAWRDGFEGRFLDSGGALAFDWEYQVHHAYAINTDLVGEGEITSVKDLLDPKWRGKIVSSDPLVGDGLMTAAAVWKHSGADVLQSLLVDQRPSITRVGWDAAMAEAFVRGSHPIARGLRPKPLDAVRARGLGQNVKYLDLPEADFVPSTALLHFDRAPHPAAARLFANWVLTREGQSILTESRHTNSARTDVPPYEADGIGATGQSYYDPDREANFTHLVATKQLVSRML